MGTTSQEGDDVDHLGLFGWEGRGMESKDQRTGGQKLALPRIAIVAFRHRQMRLGGWSKDRLEWWRGRGSCNGRGGLELV